MNSLVQEDTALITASLEQAAERCEDLTPLVFEAFFAMHPEAPALFGDHIEVAKGRMLQEILDIVLEQAGGAGYVEHTVKTSAADHSHWGVDLVMYRDVFRALIDSLKKLLGDAWSADTEAAWQRQIDAILALTHEAYGMARPRTATA